MNDILQPGDVGPVLIPGETAQAIILAVRELNRDVGVVDRGGYVRVNVPGRCVLTAESVRHWLNGPFDLPGDLERVMPSFRGRMTLDGETVCWSVG
ncbi:MAG: MmoB/DmpM family protein [Planctomycetaceae bacterium]|nr:MmoB/DmpM family protein [Planctomycetaceae bacterium]